MLRRYAKRGPGGVEFEQRTTVRREARLAESNAGECACCREYFAESEPLDGVLMLECVQRQWIVSVEYLDHRYDSRAGREQRDAKSTQQLDGQRLAINASALAML